jgi:hypothetical protein
MPPIVQPSVRETAFNCPHCFALTTQYWFDLHAKPVAKKTAVPFVADNKLKEKLLNSREEPDEKKEALIRYVEQLLAGLVMMREESNSEYVQHVDNLHLSVCYNCKKIAVWIHTRLLFPMVKAGTQPNPALPNDIVRDFEEAREIVNASPRGAAALLRLCIQKLCKHLGEGGKNIDDDIASLVKKGLDPLVQQSLDIVRVIGNEAVHPGVIDLKDDQEIALHLFDIVNAITAQMISHPKTVRDMYAKLPEGKRKAIEARDKK